MIVAIRFSPEIFSSYGTSYSPSYLMIAVRRFYKNTYLAQFFKVFYKDTTGVFYAFGMLRRFFQRIVIIDAECGGIEPASTGILW